MSKLREQNMPSEDLSDLAAPAKPRGSGLADLVGESSVAAPRPRPADGGQDEDQAPIPTPIRAIGAVRDVDGSAESRGRRPGRPRTRVRPVTAVYVSPGVKQRFEAYRHKQKVTNLQVVLKAISSMHDRTRPHDWHRDVQYCAGRSALSCRFVGCALRRRRQRPDRFQPYL